MVKVSFLPGEDERGVHVLPLFGVHDAVFEKTAAPTLLPEVATYITALTPSRSVQYVLVNALGAWEWWGNNSNGDAFNEAGLIHRPVDWTSNPLIDRLRSKDWPYGFPTFYRAKAFCHHKNKDPEKSIGDVELAAWNPRMKRVELIVRLEEDRCAKFGGQGFWDKLQMGEYPSVSMGSRVPFDCSSITLDVPEYRKAQATFDPKKYRSPGDAVLVYHKALIAKTGRGIRGLAVTRKDYDEFTKDNLNRILPDGRKVFVHNDYPNFFDISFVFVGADKTAKTMMKLGWSLSGAELGEQLYGQESEKVAAAPIKTARVKGAEIVKDVLPSQFAGRAVPLLTRNEPDLPKELLNQLGRSSYESALATPSALGIVLRPREFQRVTLIHIGQEPLADQLEASGTVFPPATGDTPLSFGGADVSLLLARLLQPFLARRSSLGPFIEPRSLWADLGEGSSPSDSIQEKSASTSSLPVSLLYKLGSAYSRYREVLMSLIPSTSSLIGQLPMLRGVGIGKTASSFVTPLTSEYLKTAFLDERAHSGVEGREISPENTRFSV